MSATTSSTTILSQQQLYGEQSILAQFAQIEKENKVRVLYAVEAGSRANGLASPDSDHDIRFIFIHELDWYLSVDEELPEEIRFKSKTDQNIECDWLGWDLRKTLRLLRRSNPPLLEWLQSPVVYIEKKHLVDQLRQLANQYHNRYTMANHYLQMAKTNWVDYIKDKELVNRKRYLYIIRSLACALYMKQHPERTTLPPIDYEEVLSGLVQVPEDAKRDLDALLVEKKTKIGDWEKQPKIESLNRWITQMREEVHQYAKQLREIEEKNNGGKQLMDFAVLNQIFLAEVKNQHQQKQQQQQQ